MNSLAPNFRAKSHPPLPPDFFLRDTLEVGRDLIGKGLWVKQKGALPVLVEILEVESYLGTQDAASHAFRGLTKRNWPMFEEGGTCYVYLSYGVNYCMNVATRNKGVGEAVLLRAAQPLMGLPVIQGRRGSHVKETQLLNGPGKLTQGLAIGLEDNGRVFDKPDFKIIDLERGYSRREIGSSPRIGISKAADRPWRFFLRNSPWLSRKG